jgi:hypothetical protein
MKCFLGTAVLTGLFFAVSRPAIAQYPSTLASPTYRSPALRSPTISPWLDLFRRNEGVLDNYNQFVRPQQQLRRAMAQQQNEITSQRLRQRRIQSEIGALQRDGRGHMPTGVGGTFQNYLHYYPSYQQGAGAR